MAPTAVIEAGHISLSSKINGILLSKPDYPELVAAINYLLNNPGLTNSMGVQGQRHVKQYELGLIVERQVAFCASFV